MRIDQRSIEAHPILIIFIFLVFAGCSSTSSVQNIEPPTNYRVNDSGMWLPSQLKGTLLANIKEQGLRVDASSIYDPQMPSLDQAVVRININKNLAGTGSFVSSKGLILTNYNTALSAIIAASDNPENYLEKGFYADSRPNEIPLGDYEIYVPVEQKEVTGRITQQLGDSLTYRQRYMLSQKIRKEIIADRRANNPNLIVEINDFWGGNRQFMSVYKVIRDVRLVHAPPESLALADQHRSWPQHAANYAFLRAYVSPDGNSRKYHPTNIPFKPAAHLDITTDEISDQDFTMVIGFPGETSRHESSHALEFYYNYRNPITIESYQAILKGFENAADQNAQAALKSFGQRTSLAETIDYYQGLQQGVKDQQIIEQKKQLEEGFKKWYEKDSLRNVRYKRVLEQLDQAYRIASQTGDLLHATVYTINNTQPFQIAALYDSYRKRLADPSLKEIPKSYKDSLLAQHQNILAKINIKAQHSILSNMLYMLATLPDGKVMFHLLELFEGSEGAELTKKIERYLQTQRSQSIIYNIDRAQNFLALPMDSVLHKPADPLVELYRAIMESYNFSKKNYVQHIAYQKPAFERYLQGMMEYKPELYRYPDANGTLRISTGQVKGYHPRENRSDASGTTLGDLKSPSKFALTGPGDLTVNFLTTNDVTGGSAGSPVLNGDGKLIGITFDNRTKGLAGDYKYNPTLSRAFNVNARYILLVMKQFQTKQLLKEVRSSK